MNSVHALRSWCLSLQIVLLLYGAAASGQQVAKPAIGGGVAKSEPLAIPSIDSIKRVDRQTRPNRSEAETMTFITRTKPHSVMGTAYMIVTDHDDKAYLEPLQRLAEFRKGVLVHVDNLATLHATKSAREQFVAKLREIKPRFLAIAPRPKSYRENMLLGLWEVIMSNSPDGQLNLFPGLLVAPNAKAFAALIDRSIHYETPALDGVRPFVIGQVADSTDKGMRSLQKVGIFENVFSERGCDMASLLVHTYRARSIEVNQRDKSDTRRQWEVTVAAPRQFVAAIPSAARKAVDDASLLLLFGHGAPGMSCSLDVKAYHDIKMDNKVVLCGSCFSASPAESDFPAMAQGSDGSPIHNDRERFAMRAIENGAVVVVGHMRECTGFPHVYPVLETWMDGLTVGEAYQRLINAIVYNTRLLPDELVLQNGTNASRPEVQRRNAALYVIIGDPAVQPLPCMTATKKLAKADVEPKISSNSDLINHEGTKNTKEPLKNYQGR